MKLGVVGVSIVVTGLLCFSGGCSGGGRTASVTVPGSFRALSISPSQGDWVAGDVIPTVVYSRVVAPESVDDSDLRLLDAAGNRVPGTVRLDGDRLSFAPAQPLAEGAYVFHANAEVLAFDGTPLELIALAPVRFVVRPAARDWSAPVLLGSLTEPASAPVFANDTIGGACVAWRHGGDVLVAEYDRDVGWQSAQVVDRVGATDGTVLVARGAGTVLVATVLPSAGVRNETVLRLRTSRGFDRTRRRVWSPVDSIQADVVTAPMVGVDAVGNAFVLFASTRLGQTQLRVLWFDGQLRQREEVLGRAGESFTIDGLWFGRGGEVMLAWTMTDGPAREYSVRVLRGAGWEPSLALPLAPRRGGIHSDGNAWLMLPDGPTHFVFLSQDAWHWTDARPRFEAALETMVGRNFDLLQLQWRSNATVETLTARRLDRFGRQIAESVLAGPTDAAIRNVVLHGDADGDVIAAWREGQGIRTARGDGTRFGASVAWQQDFAPVPLERAVLTPAGGRLMVTWLQGQQLASTYLAARLAPPRPALNGRVSTSATPLLDERFEGTSLGALLVLWSADGVLRAQALQ